MAANLHSFHLQRRLFSHALPATHSEEWQEESKKTEDDPKSFYSFGLVGFQLESFINQSIISFRSEETHRF